MDVLFFLLISSMMISSGEGSMKWGEKPDETHRMETKQCSVFPGRPKCFEPIKDFRSEGMEVTGYNREPTVENINTGESVEIFGVNISGWTNVGRMRLLDRSGGLTVGCTKDTDYNDMIHGTRFWKPIGEDWENVVYLNAKDVVITTRREKWSCSETGTNTGFYRMVSEHLTKKIVGKVRFPAGTSIHRIPIPRSRHDEQQMYRAVIREIKYTDLQFVKKKFDGYFQDYHYKNAYFDMAEENTGDFIELEKSGSIVTVSNYSAPDSSGKIIYKRKPLIKTEEVFKDRQSKATCYRLDMDHFKTNLSFGIFPEWSYSVDDGGTYTSINSSSFHEKFIITMYQIIVCKIESQQEPNVFFRVEIEYLFTEDVNEVHVTDTIDNIYKFKLPKSSTETSFGIVENIDFKPNTTDAFRFAGTATIDESYTLWDDGELHMKEVPVQQGQSEQDQASKPSKQDKKPKPSKALKNIKKFFCCFS